MAGEPDAGSQGVESEAMREALMRSWRARRARRVEGVMGGRGVLAEGGSGAEMMLALGVVLMGGWLEKGGREGGRNVPDFFVVGFDVFNYGAEALFSVEWDGDVFVESGREVSGVAGEY
jgi:hypothetical protein